MTRSEKLPKVSVIMNAYYSKDYLVEAIASVVAQTYSNWEIILWENESADGTREIAESFNDSRIHYFHAPEKVPLYESRMNALQLARGELVAFLDCDDVWHTDKLNKQVPVFLDPNCVISCTDFFIRREGHKASKSQVTIERFDTYRSVTTSRYEVSLDYRVGMSSVMARLASARAVWPFPAPDYSVIEDFDMVIRLIGLGSLIPVSEPLMTYRRHGNNFSSRLDIEMSEWLNWIEHIERHDMTVHERDLIREHVEKRLFLMKCRLDRLRGDRMATWRNAKLLRFGPIKIRLLFSLMIPTPLLRKMMHP